MDMDERKIRILQAIINDYITYGEPVGSRTISKKYNLGVSSATIRNEMADLEEMGFLEQLHSSSGRRPSDKGYRLYVDKLMNPPALTDDEYKAIRKYLDQIVLSEVDNIIKAAIDIVSNLTQLTSVVKIAPMKKSRIKYIKLLAVDKNIALCTIVIDNGNIKNSTIRVASPISDEKLVGVNNILQKLLVGISIEEINLEFLVDLKEQLTGYEEIFESLVPVLHDILVSEDNGEVYTRGATNIFNYPEYNNIDKAKAFLGLISNEDNLKQIVTSPSADNNMLISIGHENFIEGAEDCSVITASYNCRGNVMGTIGVIGPTRMQYDKVVAVLNTVVKEINEHISKLYDP